MSDMTDVGILGATGMVGSRLVELLRDHPWLRLAEVGASPSSVGTVLDRAVPTHAGDRPSSASAALEIRGLEGAWSSPLLISALPSGVAGPVETRLADEGHLVVSNASAHRLAEGVPLVVPEVNPDHLELLGDGPSGGLVTNPNCVAAGLAVALAPLHRALGIEAAVLTTFQAVSGAGRPGPAASDLLDNVIPHIPGEEEKMGPELRKILGRLEDGRVTPASFEVSATTTRVPVQHGHLAAVSLAFSEDAGPERVREVLRGFRSPVDDLELPLAPERPLEVLDDPDRPQPRLDRDRGRGMTVSVGRIRPCPVLGVKMLVLSHNLVRGAAGAALVNAELCRARGAGIGGLAG